MKSSRARDPCDEAAESHPPDLQVSLLARLRWRALVFSGRESDDERLAMLQLYAAGLVSPFAGDREAEILEWRITERGRTARRAS